MKRKQSFKEQRIAALLKLKRRELIDVGVKMGMRNIGFKTIDKKNPERSKIRANEDIASLIYYKELGK